MHRSRRIPLIASCAGAALVGAGLPVLAAAAWRTFVWQTPGTPDAAASLDGLTAAAAVLGLLVAVQLVLLSALGREVAGAGADTGRLESAVRRILAGARTASALGAMALVVVLAAGAAAAVRAAGPGFDWPAFALALVLLAGPALATLAAPAAFVRLPGADPAGVALASQRVRVGTVVTLVALGAVLLGASAAFAGAQAACQPSGSAALCDATNTAIGEVAGLIGPAVALPYLALAGRALHARWALFG